MQALRKLEQACGTNQHKDYGVSGKGTIATHVASLFSKFDYSTCAKMHLDCYPL